MTLIKSSSSTENDSDSRSFRPYLIGFLVIMMLVIVVVREGHQSNNAQSEAAETQSGHPQK
ncbi:hypothetical protein KC851_04260 [Candidatus Kaiserbacteria bacterium]|nr:hypothetical protein [Candidatus Kaiserbacteria bacterium]